MPSLKINSGQGAGATSETAKLVKSQPVGRIDPEWKRQAFLALKEANDQGKLIPPERKGFSRKVREAVAAAYDGRCDRCGEPLKPGFHLDHVTERDLGGSNDVNNLVPLHPECHRIKTSARAPVLAHVHRLAKIEAEGRKPSTMKSRPFDGWRKFGGTPVRARKA